MINCPIGKSSSRTTMQNKQSESFEGSVPSLSKEDIRHPKQHAMDMFFRVKKRKTSLSN